MKCNQNGRCRRGAERLPAVIIEPPEFVPKQFIRSIRFEVAQDVLGAVIAHWSAQAAEVRDAANPDASRLATIQAEQRKLRTLRDELDPHDAA